MDFMDLDSPEDDQPIIVKDEEDEEVHVEKDDAEKSQNSKLKKEKIKVEAEVAFLSAQPTYPNVEQLSELLAKIKTLDSLLSLLNKVTEALDRFAQAIEHASQKAGDQGVPLAGQAGTHPVEGKKNIKTSYNHSSSPQPEGELIKKDKGKKAMSSRDAGEEGIETESDEANLTGPMGESSKKKKLKKFDFVIEGGDHIHLTVKQIKEQKRIEESIKADLAKQEMVLGKKELVDLLGIDVVKGFYKAKLHYDKYCDKMLNRMVQSKITNCDVLTRKGPITLKVYKEDGTNEIIPDLKASDLHLGEWREVMQVCPNIKGAGWSTIYGQIKTRMDYLHKTKAELEINFSKSLSQPRSLNHQFNFVTIEDFRDFSNEMLYTEQELFFRLHQGPRLDDHARTFSSFLLAEVDKRNLNPLKKMRTIKQLSQWML
ncbi:hypothetical protein Tco_0682432 [Tanacetum coccineum]|uniref:Uncharacterized protein n=1 Tax=Tanacetum coccineum TaxID=301880 RepID=A0ABQ4XS66_9ASTR